jgi:hypothetical protein
MLFMGYTRAVSRENSIFVICSGNIRAVPATDDSRTASCALQDVDDERYDRSFSGASRGDIPDADDGNMCPMNRKPPVLISRISGSHDQAVAHAQASQHRAQQHSRRARRLPADQPAEFCFVQRLPRAEIRVAGIGRSMAVPQHWK